MTAFEEACEKIGENWQRSAARRLSEIRPSPDDKIVMFHPWVSPDAGYRVSQVLKTRWIGEGPRVKEFEDRLSKEFGLPYCLAVNSGTAALRLALALCGVGPGDEVISVAQTCVVGTTSVLLPDGKTMPIRTIVNQRLPLRVMSLNEKTGELEPAEVVDYVKIKKSEGHDWYKLGFENNRSSRVAKGKYGVFVTGDHQVLTRRGWIEIQDLRGDDEIATCEKQLNPRQREAIDGMMLGDGYVQVSGKTSCRLTFTHCDEQKEWIDLKAEILADFAPLLQPKVAHPPSGPGWSLQTCAGMEWRRYRQRWYTAEKKRRVPDDLVLTPLMLAAWYMDDGSLVRNQPVFCTDRYDLSEFYKLFWKMADMGFKPRVLSCSRKIHRISLATDGGDVDRFFEMIGPYVLPCMRYKVPDGTPPFDPSRWVLGKAEIGFAKAEVEKATPSKYHHPDTAFCITVKGNGNFISGNVVLHNCTATNTPILEQFATPVFADIQYETGNIDPKDIEHRITEKTKAIMCVHWAGYPCDMSALDRISEAYLLPIIQDGAHALGATYMGVGVAAWTEFCMFSFQAIKQLTTGDGGLLALCNAENYHEGRRRRWFGIDRDNREQRLDGYSFWDQSEVGYKMQMNDIAASIGLANLEDIDWILERRAEIAARYRAALADVPGVQLFEQRGDRTSGNWLFTMHVERRDDFCRMMRDKGIEVSVVHIRNDLHSIFGPRRDDLPNTDRYELTHISIPLHNHLSDDQVERVIGAIQGGW